MILILLIKERLKSGLILILIVVIGEVLWIASFTHCENNIIYS